MTKRPRTRSRRGPLLMAAGLLASVLVAVAPGPVAAQATADADRTGPPLSWAPCHEDITAGSGVAYQCTSVAVPLEYDRPRDTTVLIALVRIPATDPARRIGSLLVNPGGPGGSGVDFVLGFGPFIGQAFGPEVPARFDLVGFDPRGIAASTPLLCFPTFDDALAAASPVAFPVTDREEQRVIAADSTLRQACKRRGGDIGRHMSTANVARDLDVIRQRLGDDKLTFAGYSYGTFIAATYANLFPSRVRAIVADGVLDPVAWVNRGGRVPFSTALRSDQGAQVTLEQFFQLCTQAQPGTCALAPDPAGRFARLLDSLRSAPRQIVADPGTGATVTVTYADTVAITAGLLTDAFAYPALAGLLAFLEQPAGPAAVVAPPAVRAALQAYHHPKPGPVEPYPNVVEGFPGVACVDTDNPSNPKVWSQAGAAADRQFGYFGRYWTWASSPCAQWPLSDGDRYTGPFTAATANPVLIIGNLYDPSTRYQGAQALRRLLPRSGLLTVDVPGHTSLGANACAGAITGRYLIDPGVARTVDGQLCPAEYNPFDLVAGAPSARVPTGSTSAATSPELRQAALDHIRPPARR